MTNWTPARSRAVRRLQDQRIRWHDDPVRREIAERAVTLSLSAKRRDVGLAGRAWRDAKKQLERDLAREKPHPLQGGDGVDAADVEAVICRDRNYLANHPPSVERVLAAQEALTAVIADITATLGTDAARVAELMNDPVADTAATLGFSESKVKHLRAQVRAFASTLPHPLR